MRLQGCFRRYPKSHLISLLSLVRCLSHISWIFRVHFDWKFNIVFVIFEIRPSSQKKIKPREKVVPRFIFTIFSKVVVLISRDFSHDAENCPQINMLPQFQIQATYDAFFVIGRQKSGKKHFMCCSFAWVIIGNALITVMPFCSLSCVQFGEQCTTNHLQCSIGWSVPQNCSEL